MSIESLSRQTFDLLFNFIRRSVNLKAQHLRVHESNSGKEDV